MVPYVIVPTVGCVAIHVSGLAVHTRNLQARPQVSLLIMQPETQDEPVHALPRVTLEGVAMVPEPESREWHACRKAYLGRFPEAEPMMQLGDFMFVAIQVSGARQVAGFGAARSIAEDDLRQVLGPRPDPA